MRIPPLLLALLAAPPSELLLAQAAKRPFSINDDVLAYPQVRASGFLVIAFREWLADSK